MTLLLPYCTAFAMTVSLIRCDPIFNPTEEYARLAAFGYINVPTDFDRLYCSRLTEHGDRVHASTTPAPKDHGRRYKANLFPPTGTPRAVDVSAFVSLIRSRVTTAAGRTAGPTANDRGNASGWPPTSLTDAIVETLRRNVGTENDDDDGEQCVERIVNLVREAIQARRNVEYQKSATAKQRLTTTGHVTAARRAFTSSATAGKRAGIAPTKYDTAPKLRFPRKRPSVSDDPRELSAFGSDIQPNLIGLVNGYTV